MCEKHGVIINYVFLQVTLELLCRMLIRPVRDLNNLGLNLLRSQMMVSSVTY